MNDQVFSSPIFSAAGAMPVAPVAKKAYVIVLGNEKGGSGKTTTCMHLIISLLRLGFTVGSIDIDSRQRSLSRYLENRRQTMLKEGVTLPQPQHIVIQRSPFNIVQEAEEDERERFTKALARVAAANDFVVVDSPGSDTFLARVAHAHADTVITPINDSFVDLDVLATVDGQTMKIIKPSIYSEMVWEQKLQRAKRDGGSIEWIVMRNRLSNIDAKNKRFMTQVTTDLSRRIGFRVAPGFSERVIFREMFLQGLTVLDIMEAGGNTSLSLSHVAARQEVRDLLKTLQIPLITDRISKARVEGEPEQKTAEEKAREQNAKAKAEAKPEAGVRDSLIAAGGGMGAGPSLSPSAELPKAAAPAAPVAATAAPAAPVVSAPVVESANAEKAAEKVEVKLADKPVMSSTKEEPVAPVLSEVVKAEAPKLETPKAETEAEKIEPAVELAS